MRSIGRVELTPEGGPSEGAAMRLLMLTTADRTVEPSMS